MKQDEIDDYLAKVGNELNTIDTLENKDRVLAKYQMHKDLNRAISETNIEIERERKIEADRELAKAREEARRVEIENRPPPEIVVVEPEPKEEPKILTMAFEVKGTIEQLKSLKAFLVENNIKFKGV